MIVTPSELAAVVDRLMGEAYLAVDTETFGLRPFHGDQPFSIVIASATEEFYLPVAASSGVSTADVITDLSPLDRLFAEPRTYLLHNAKFDLHHLATLGLELSPLATIVDTMVMARLIHSDLPGGYSLANCAEYFLAEKKDDRVKAYVDEHELWTKVEIPGLAASVKLLHYDQVPLDIMLPYAELDARLTYRLAVHLASVSAPEIADVTTNEQRLTQTCYRMEKAGVRIDRGYCERALAYERQRFGEATIHFAAMTGEPYVVSGQAFGRAFAAVGVSTDELAKTATGKTSFDSDQLAKLEHPAAQHALTAKDAKARINFLSGFIHASDDLDLIHTNLRQSGTKHGRFSSSEPNLQNLKRPDEDDAAEAFPIRRAIVPYSPDYCLAMIDYSQIEYRVMLDYAGEMPMIEKILSGLDVHTATAELTGISRQRAKTLNFAVIYGAGAARIAEMLGLDLAAATQLIATFYAGLPRVEAFLREVKRRAKVRGYIYNWFGRRVHYPDRSTSYTAPNHLVSGSCADILKIAMNRVDDLLTGHRSVMSLTVHDELVFNMHRDELDLVPEIKLIMEAAYPHRHLPLAAEVSHSWVSLADKVRGLPQVPR